MKKINNQNWKKFKIFDFFDINAGTKLDRTKMNSDNPSIAFVGRSNLNNGITDFVNEIDGIKPYNPGCLTLALGGAYLGSCFVQENKFYTSQNVVVLIPKKDMSNEVKQFIATAIFKESQTHYEAFKNELNRHIKKDFAFLLPVDKDGNLDINFITNFMNDLYYETINRISLLINISLMNKSRVDISNWKTVRLSELFEITGSKTTDKNELNFVEDGEYPYITTKATNNGVDGFTHQRTEEGGCLTVDSATNGICFFQKLNFTASDHVEKLIPKFNMTENVALFISTVINVEGKILNYEYNEKRSQKALKKETIYLPFKDNNLDFAFMDNYIEKLAEEYNERFITLFSLIK